MISDLRILFTKLLNSLIIESLLKQMVKCQVVNVAARVFLNMWTKLFLLIYSTWFWHHFFFSRLNLSETATGFLTNQPNIHLSHVQSADQNQFPRSTLSEVLEVSENSVFFHLTNRKKMLWNKHKVLYINGLWIFLLAVHIGHWDWWKLTSWLLPEAWRSLTIATV